MKNPDGFAYIVDIDKDMKWKRIWIVALEDIPSGYLPNQAATYEADDFEPYSEKLRIYLDYHFSRREKLHAPARYSQSLF